eukprot:TRINITY_DN9347_c0_g1_i1.p1 TRINITY_DN9347_c0_g1~~TRINITY_DN9347_c0_g1_i1.p1  ORF type:complete len:434 (+),score=145.07 TRINITY_DN9347_c0_g1_i1:35-1336(+)
MQANRRDINNNNNNAGYDSEDEETALNPANPAINDEDRIHEIGAADEVHPHLSILDRINRIFTSVVLRFVEFPDNSPSPSGWVIKDDRIAAVTSLNQFMSCVVLFIIIMLMVVLIISGIVDSSRKEIRIEPSETRYLQNFNTFWHSCFQTPAYSSMIIACFEKMPELTKNSIVSEKKMRMQPEKERYTFFHYFLNNGTTGEIVWQNYINPRGEISLYWVRGADNLNSIRKGQSLSSEAYIGSGNKDGSLQVKITKSDDYYFMATLTPKKDAETSGTIYVSIELNSTQYDMSKASEILVNKDDDSLCLKRGKSCHLVLQSKESTTQYYPFKYYFNKRVYVTVPVVLSAGAAILLLTFAVWVLLMKSAKREKQSPLFGFLGFDDDDDEYGMTESGFEGSPLLPLSGAKSDVVMEAAASEEEGEAGEDGDEKFTWS